MVIMLTMWFVLSVWFALMRSAVACSGRVHIVDSLKGEITDGGGKYNPSRHCEWLIEGECMTFCVFEKKLVQYSQMC